ncbi:MAG: hypothetical protein ACRCX8_19490 [Sarcina sp.]
MEGKKPKKKKGCLIAIIVVIVIIIILIIAGIAGASGTNSNATVNTTNNSQSSDSSSNANISAQLNTPFQMGNYKVTVSNIQNTNSIQQAGVTVDQTKNNLFIFNLKIENTTSNPIASLAIADQFSDAKVITLTINGDKYFVNADDSIDASSANNNAFNTAFTAGNNINPNTPYSTNLVIPTPDKVTNGTLTLNIGGKTANVDIKNS